MGKKKNKNCDSQGANNPHESKKKGKKNPKQDQQSTTNTEQKLPQSTPSVAKIEITNPLPSTKINQLPIAGTAKPQILSETNISSPKTYAQPSVNVQPSTKQINPSAFTSRLPQTTQQSVWGPSTVGKLPTSTSQASGNQQKGDRVTEQQKGNGRSTNSKKQISENKQLTLTGKPEYIRTKDSYDLVRRNEKGTKGDPIRIEVNYVKLNLEKIVKSIFHYDITFTPDTSKKMLPFIFQIFREIHFPETFLAFDGQRNVFSARRLPISQILEANVVYRDEVTTRDKHFKITLKEVGNPEIDMTALFRANDTKPVHQINCLDIILRTVFQCQAVAVGKQFYTRPNRKIDLGGGFELWTGLYQSAVLGKRPYLNVDIIHKSFHSAMGILELVETFGFRLNRELDQKEKNCLSTYLKDLKLIYETAGVAPKVHKFLGFKDTAQRQTFSFEDGTKLTVEEYFRRKGQQLRYSHMPCIHVGNTMRNIYLPMEFCSIQYGQPFTEKMSERQTSNMIKETARKTDTCLRKEKIMDKLRLTSHNSSPVLQQFGINIDNKFVEINARILKPPVLEYKNRQKVFVKDGVWRVDRQSFINAKTISKWHILVLDNIRDSIINDFIGMIKKYGQSLNMIISGDHEVSYLKKGFNNSDIDTRLKKLKDSKIELLFVVIPIRFDLYPSVKKAAEIRCVGGMLTQCVKSCTLENRLDPSTVTNILLKVNTKLNGTNHKIEQNSCPNIIKDSVMIIGADVTHPSSFREPSVVGVAASHDENSMSYHMDWRLQLPNKEIIDDFKNIMVDQLRYYKIQQKKLPKIILYYRDGVSDERFQEVIDHELRAMYAACHQIDPNYKPKVTFIIAKKRHHTRFFPLKTGKTVGKYNNACPGTIVDTDITEQNEQRFFLLAHASIQGVARPTCYCVIWDDSNIPVDELQALTYNLCHIFVRCNRAVSYIAPTYYAHLAAARGKVYITGENINLEQLDQEQNRRRIKTEIVDGHPMFFI